MTEKDIRLPDPEEAARIEHASPGSWVALTFAASMALNIATSEFFWAPSFLSLTIIFWTLRQPESSGMAAAFVCGILMDAINGAVLGQHALAYVTICYLTTVLSRRLPLFGPAGQALHILPILVFSQVLVMLARLWFDGLWPGWEWFLSSLAGALAWPLWIRVLRPRSRADATL